MGTHSTQITEDPSAHGKPDRNLALELVRVTEAAALAAARWVGMGERESADLLDLDRPLAETLGLVAKRKSCDIRDVMVVMLDRERHQDAVREIREAGARIRFITDGDVSAALLAVTERTPVDLLWGIGGEPQGGVSPAALKSIGRQNGGRPWAPPHQGRPAPGAAGHHPRRSPAPGPPPPRDTRLLAAP